MDAFEEYEDYEDYNDFAEHLGSVKERVEYLLRRYPNARNSDLYLIILYFRYFTELGKYIRYIPYSLIRKYEGITETIRRMRQKIQNEEGKYPPTDPEVLKKRRIKQEKLRRTINNI